VLPKIEDILIGDKDKDKKKFDRLLIAYDVKVCKLCSLMIQNNSTLRKFSR